MDTHLIITLLTVAVILLSLVIIVLLVAVTIVVLKIRQLVRSTDRIINNVAKASDWLSPIKLFSAAAKAFRK